MYLAVLGCAVALAAYAIAVSLPLLGDGVLFYLCMIFRTGFCDFDWARAFVAYISQWPLAASLGNGLADRSTAQLLFSAGYIVPPIMGGWLYRAAYHGLACSALAASWNDAWLVRSSLVLYDIPGVELVLGW